MTVSLTVVGIYLWAAEQRNGPIRWFLECVEHNGNYMSVHTDYRMDSASVYVYQWKLLSCYILAILWAGVVPIYFINKPEW